LKRKTYEICAATDKGKVRKTNEDNFFVNDFFLSFAQANLGCSYKAETAEPFFVGISDGMGGERCGEEASFASVSGCAEAFRRNKYRCLTDIKECINKINANICTGNQHAGATLAAVSVDNGKVIASSIGDSRIYSVSNGKLRQVSRDHTVAQLHVEAGLMTKDEARDSKFSHGLTQYLGIPQEEMTISADFFEFELNDGDALLLCSDGLSHMISDSEIEDILKNGNAEENVCDLVERALENGGKDNVTVMVIK